MKVVLNKIKEKVMGYTIIKVEVNIKANGKIINVKDMEYIIIIMVRNIMAFGKMI